jgi:hypothetical protein
MLINWRNTPNHHHLVITNQTGGTPMLANVNEKTNIRYGVVSQSTIHPDVLDELWTIALAKACGDEPDGQPFEYEGVTVSVTTLGGAPLVFIMESPVIVKARPCSPCVPNAGDLDNLDPDYGIECYGLPEDWLSNY